MTGYARDLQEQEFNEADAHVAKALELLVTTIGRSRLDNEAIGRVRILLGLSRERLAKARERSSEAA